MSVEVTGFQLASTALTVTVNEEPAVCAVGVPVLPVAVPGAAVSPGIRIWSFEKAAALIVVDGLVLAVFAPSLMSEAVNVAAPAVFGVIENVLVPLTSAALAGSVALASVEVIPAVSVTELTTFQLASTALTVTLNAEPAVRADGVPVLPLAVPGAAVSPGSRICSFVNAAGLIVVDGLVSAVIEPFVWSVAVTVDEPAVLRMSENVLAPATRAAGAGGVALVSLVLSATVSVEVTGFQLASTACTVTLKLPSEV